MGRNQRSADSLVRVFLPQHWQLADKAVRAPEESSPNATKLGDGTGRGFETIFLCVRCGFCVRPQSLLKRLGRWDGHSRNRLCVRWEKNTSARSAELHSAVSRIWNPPAVVIGEGVGNVSGLPNAIRRYSRLQTCATKNCVPHPPACFRAQNRVEAATGEDSGWDRETGPKANGRRTDFRTFDGLVQHRMDLTLRFAPANSILWIICIFS